MVTSTSEVASTGEWLLSLNEVRKNLKTSLNQRNKLGENYFMNRLFAEQFKSNPQNIVIATQKNGAGHWRQTMDLLIFLQSVQEETGVPIMEHVSVFDTTEVAIAEGRVNLVSAVGWLYDIINRNHPQVYTYFTNILQAAGGGVRPFINTMVASGSVSDYLLRSLVRPSVDNNYIPKLPTLFVGTHVLGAQSITDAANALAKTGGDPSRISVLEYAPDAWEGNTLAAMTTPTVYKGDHIMVVHSPEVADEVRKIRPEQKSKHERDRRIILPWGTLTNPLYQPLYTDKKEKEQQKNFQHILIEFSGNQKNDYDDLIIQFLKANAREIKNGKIRLTLHAMTHHHTVDKLNKALQESNLQDNLNVRIIHNEGFMDALASRETILMGQGDENNHIDDWGTVDFSFSKGGEPVLEDRPFAMGGVSGTGHEEDNVIAMEKEGRGLNLIGVSPDQWISKMRKHIEDNPVQERWPRAQFALLYALSKRHDIGKEVPTDFEQFEEYLTHDL